jgi:diguanylate cyclase (GGDEF)-like protein/PAS domain S-box-containing protein
LFKPLKNDRLITSETTFLPKWINCGAMIQRTPRFAVICSGLAYFCATAVAVSLTRFDGGFAFVWFGTALLVARLVTLPSRQWPAHLAICAVANLVATGWFGLGWLASPVLTVANIGEALVGAVLLRRLGGSEKPFESLDWFFAFLVACGLVSPLVGGLAAGITCHVLFGLEWMSSSQNWVIGHALGNLTLTPFAIFALGGEMRAWRDRDAQDRAPELLACIALVLAIASLVFAQERLPLLFLPIFAMIFTTFRFGRLGATLSIVIVALVASLLTIDGHGPIQLIGATTPGKIRFLQFYLATTALSILPLAIELSSRARLYTRLAESEARYRVLSDHSTDIIMNVDREGVIGFISPSIEQLGGYKPAELLGTYARDLIVADFHPQLSAFHAQLLSRAEHAVSTEYQAIRRDGSLCWFESSSRAVIGSDGEAQGVVSVVRDVSQRKALEWRLMEQALSDPLTGLSNRRAFETKLLREAASDRGACVAICDLDNFKQINDGHGHAAGDAVLRTFSKVAQSVLRTTDTVGRLGGEEFGLLLRGVSLDQARFICNRLVEIFAETVTQSGGRDIRCTVSCGLAVLGTEPEAALRAADEALYRAKAGGRDQLMMAA